MATTPPAAKNSRVYNDHERAVINPFKNEYYNAKTPKERKIIAQLHIFPALFNYWDSLGEPITEDEKKKRSEILIAWLRNNWRTKKQAPSQLKDGKKFRLTDVLWWSREEDVMIEIASIMKLPQANTYTDKWIQYRGTAIKNILESMTTVELKELEDLAEKWRVEGLPLEIQRKHAQEKWYSRLESAAKAYHREMGLVCLSIVVYTQKDGQMVVDILDRIANVMNVPSVSFEEKFSDKCNDMKRSMMQYVKSLQELGAQPNKSSGADPGAGAVSTTGSASDPKTWGIMLDSNGYPMAPPVKSSTTISKDILERLYRLYITTHYRLACRDPDRPAPFETLASQTSTFIESDYLPQGFKIKDPRSMKLKELKDFFEHVGDREQSHGIEQAFRFNKVLTSRKKGSICDSRYKDVAGEQEHGDNGITDTDTAAAAAPVQNRTMPHDIQVDDTNITSSLSTQLNISLLPDHGVTVPDTEPGQSLTDTRTQEPEPAPPMSQNRKKKQQDAPTGIRKSLRKQNFKLSDSQASPDAALDAAPDGGNGKSSRRKGKGRL